MEMKTYLNEIGLPSKSFSLRQAVDEFVLEMSNGLNGRESSLQMIPNYLNAPPASLRGKRTIAIDMGGTNLRIARVAFDENGLAHLENFVYPMPGSKEELMVSEFFDRLAGLLAPLVFQISDIGICFSFPCEILQNLDGRILSFDKEVRVNGASGLVIGEALRSAFERRGDCLGQHIVVLNDTAAAMLGGIASYGDQAMDGFAGLILGTGMNCCYFEENIKIRKNPLLARRPGRSIVNIEAGGYARFERTKVDMAFDGKTIAPGTQQLEKLVSGAYLARLLLAYIRDAAAKGCFSNAFAADIAGWNDGILAEITATMDSFDHAHSFARLCGDCNDDRLAMRDLFESYLDRAVDYLSVCLTAILEKTDLGSNPNPPACICVEGSVFDRCKPLRSRLLERMYHRVPQEFGRHCTFVHTANATLIGTAVAALSHE